MTITFSTGQILAADDLRQLIGKNAFKSTNETVNNSATVQNDDHLVVAAEADTTYAVRGFLMFTSGTTPDFKFLLTAPGGATMRLVATTFNRAGVLGSQGGDTRTVIEGETFALPGQGTTFSTQSQWIEFSGVIIMGSTAGNVQLQWAQATANASDTTLYAGSWLRLWEL